MPATERLKEIKLNRYDHHHKHHRHQRYRHQTQQRRLNDVKPDELTVVVSDIITLFLLIFRQKESA